MQDFVAIILICQIALAPESCTETNAQDVMSIHVDSELGCATGWQDVVARSAFAKDVGSTSYVKTVCRREAPESRRN